MAEVLKSFEFTARAFGGAAKYPYAEWLDGQIRKLESGKDFTAKVSTLLYMLRKRANKEGKQLRANKVDGGKAVVVQTFKPGENKTTAEPTTEPKKSKGKGKVNV